MMRLLILNYEYPPLGGGAGNATYYILKEFAHFKDLEVDLVTSSVSGFRMEQISERIRVHFLDIGKKGNLHYQTQQELLMYAWKSHSYALKLKRNKKPDLIHAFFGIPSGYVAMQLGLPYIVSLRGSDVPFYNERFKLLDEMIFKRLSQKVWKRAEAVVANSEGLKELAFQTSPKQEIDIVFNGVDTDEFTSITTDRRSEKILLISTGRLIQRKGYEYLLEALKGRSDFELVLIGDGNSRETLIKMADDLDINVNFLGRLERSELINQLHLADVFVLPSLNEGMSNSVLEALSCGLPVVATNVGGCTELVFDGVNGFVVEKADSIALADALDKYTNDRSLIAKQGFESRRIAENMSWRSVADHYLQIYRRALGSAQI
ncbi:MAG: glycosyltransferase family 4 protein [Proteobacteria bacterium]|nr:glycosyltransferase family 4 protein [Pseudomonadota bacterium]